MIGLHGDEALTPGEDPECTEEALVRGRLGNQGAPVTSGGPPAEDELGNDATVLGRGQRAAAGRTAGGRAVAV